LAATRLHPCANASKMQRRMIGERQVEGYRALSLSAEEAGGIEATFVPEAGMVGCSLRHRGEELLGQRGGLRAYVEERGTMGIPLLHPWANRLSQTRFTVAGREVALDSGSPQPSLDPNGLPIHGLLAAAAGWRVERHESTPRGGRVEAGFEFGAHPDLMEAFPFAHELLYEATLDGATLTIATTVRATGKRAVPISFGYHPYFQLPGVDRPQWEIEVPVRERLGLDRRMLPTGEREPIHVDSGPLGARTFDDGYASPPDSAPFVLAGPGRRIEVSFGAGYPYAQVYAPDDDDVVAYEPMTAPTNALVSGGPELRLADPGDPYRAEFSITLSDLGRG
jgi:aldose 1-epimerase